MIAGIIIVFLPLWYVINYHNVKEENIDQYTLSRKYKIENKKLIMIKVDTCPNSS